MTTLAQLVESAYAAGASDLHIESGLPVAVRVDGGLAIEGAPLPPAAVKAMARSAAGAEGWSRFLQTRSLDLSRTVAGVRCRINVLQSRRGVGLAVRLLRTQVPTIDRLNLHPSLKKLSAGAHGLVLVSGPTGSGKSSTIAALVQEINLTRARHIVTLEQPVEFWMKPQRSLIRQREVGTDTPSFQQGLIDALREDPDVVVVGEMRRPETMRLTLDAAETGHLVFSTIHSSSCAEAIGRVIASFSPEARAGVRAQLADCLTAVVCQRLVYRADLGIRVPECEVLRMNRAARATVRKETLAHLATVLETGGDEGSWTLDRYRRWLDGREHFHIPSRTAPGPAEAPEEGTGSGLPPLAAAQPAPSTAAPPAPAGPPAEGDVFVLDGAGDPLGTVLTELLSG